MTDYAPDHLDLPEQPCPVCGHRLNAVGQAHTMQTETPEAGDLTICIQCAEVLVFLDTGALGVAPACLLDAEVRQVQRDIRRMHRQTGWGGKLPPREEGPTP